MPGGRGFFRFHSSAQKENRMTFALVAASSVLVVLLTLGWAKEFRLRRALQSLLARVFTPRRNAHEADEPSTMRRYVSGSTDSRSRRVR